MSDFKAAKQSKIDLHKEQLETYERHAENLADQRGHTDRMFEFMRNQVRDINDLNAIRDAQYDADTRFRDAFREQVEAPSDAIKKEMKQDADELEVESRNVMRAADHAVGNDVTDGVAASIKSELGKSAKEFDAMGRKARDIMVEHDQGVNASRLRAYGMYK
jgi:hypothetical protein